MSSINLHINQGRPPSRFYLFFIGILGLAFLFFQKIRIRNLKTGLIKIVKKHLTKVYLISEGLKSVVKDFNKDRAEEEYGTAQDIANKLRYMVHKLEEINFFNDKEIKNIAESTILNFYQIEATLRTIAYEDLPAISEDKELLEFASRISLSSLPN